MRFLFVAFLSLLGAAPLVAQTREAIVLTGGPALRYLEHGKAASHDAYWFNFVDASVIRLTELKAQANPNLVLSWLVFRPGYVARGEEMESDLLDQIHHKADALGVNLFYFDTTDQLINFFNVGRDRDKIKVGSFDYFGHSNKACFLFDYSSYVDTMSVNFLHVRDLHRIRGRDFARDAVCKSWGCHSGEMYSQWWKSQLDVALIGALGKTDFSRGGTPVLSDETTGKWVQ